MADDVGTWNFNIYKGAKFTKTLTLTDDDDEPIDLTGYEAFLTIDDVEYEGVVDLTGDANKITFEMLASVTDELVFVSAKHRVEIVPPAGDEHTERILQGHAFLL